MPPVDVPGLLHQLYLVCKYYRLVGLAASELEVVLAILIASIDQPGITLSNRMLAALVGKVPRAVQVHIHTLQVAELLVVRPSFHADGGQVANSYDLSPLFAAIEEVAP